MLFQEILDSHLALPPEVPQREGEGETHPVPVSLTALLQELLTDFESSPVSCGLYLGK